MLNIKTWRDLKNITTEMIATATDKELSDLYDRIARPFDNSAIDKASYNMFEEEWMNKVVVDTYWMVSNEMDRRYRNEEEPKIREFFHNNFEGKTITEIRNNEELSNNWNFYSDWHKDVFGYRPHAIVCGEYVSPY